MDTVSAETLATLRSRQSLAERRDNRWGRIAGLSFLSTLATGSFAFYNFMMTDFSIPVKLIAGAGALFTSTVLAGSQISRQGWRTQEEVEHQFTNETFKNAREDALKDRLFSEVLTVPKPIRELMDAAFERHGARFGLFNGACTLSEMRSAFVSIGSGSCGKTQAEKVAAQCMQ